MKMSVPKNDLIMLFGEVTPLRRAVDLCAGAPKCWAAYNKQWGLKALTRAFLVSRFAQFSFSSEKSTSGGMNDPEHAEKCIYPMSNQA
jgi:hypothetical protein